MLDLIRYANSKGFLVNNLFQLSETTWKCSLRSATDGCEFGEGASASEALRRALAKARVETVKLKDEDFSDILG